MNIKYIAALVTAGVAGFVGGYMLAQLQTKRHAEKYVEEAWAKAEMKAAEMPEIEGDKEPAAETFKAITANYVSKSEKPSAEPSYNSSEEKADEQVKEVKGEQPEMANPFRLRTFASGARRCTEAEYFNGDAKDEVSYYTGDDCFYSSDGNIIEDWEQRFGNDIVDYFGTTSDDPDLVHIYNIEEDCYYEISRHLGCYNPK